MNKLIKLFSIVIAGFCFSTISFAADVTMKISIQLPMKSHLGQNLLLFKNDVDTDYNLNIQNVYY